jgi:eukaryotic-like serine/threonine-protein kinase
MRRPASIEVASTGDFSLITVTGSVDEHFGGFGVLGDCQVAVIDVTGIERISSFGVRQWIAAMTGLPKSITDTYLLGCQPWFVDQLNMVLNFGGTAKILSVIAPYVCPACHAEAALPIDVLAERVNLARGEVPHRKCQKCEASLELDETPESYFSFLSKYAATRLHPHAAQMLQVLGRFKVDGVMAEAPPRILKIVHGAVTYFQISGVLAATFKARPLLVGAEGEIVLDLAEVERMDASALVEWKRLLKSLTGLVPHVTIVDLWDTAAPLIGETLVMPRVSLASLSVPFSCAACGRRVRESIPCAVVVAHKIDSQVCGTCGGVSTSQLAQDVVPLLGRISTRVPDDSGRLIGQRAEIRSRAVTDANVAQAGVRKQEGDPELVLGKYRIIRRLSEGGMADIFLATQVGIEKTVAVKRIQHKLLEARQKAIELFLNEAKIASRLTHPNIVQVLDVGEDNGDLYLAMEYVHGRDMRSLTRKLRQRGTPLPLGETCHVVREVARALDFAYWSTDMNDKQMAVVHRDVTPHNIIVSYDGSVKLLDFGVAMSNVTAYQGNMIVGKWLYMSPEATAQQPLDHRSDLFSLGVVFYYLCTGATPFAGRDPSEIVTGIRSGVFEAMWRAAPDIPRSLSALVDRMLALNPQNRPQRGQDVVRELSDIMRAEGLERSGTDLARFLGKAFPQDVGEPVPRVSDVLEAVGPTGIDLTVKDPTPSITGYVEKLTIDRSASFHVGNIPKLVPSEDTQRLRIASPVTSWWWVIAVIAFAAVIAVVIVLR